jgi:isopropylmalate/homocitrate/citramalate synthase
MDEPVRLTEVFWRETPQTMDRKYLEPFSADRLGHIIQECLASGLKSLELGSIVKYSRIPSMSPERLKDIFRIAGEVPHGAEYIVLIAPSKIINMEETMDRYLNQFFDYGLDQKGHTVGLFTSMVDDFARKNVGMSGESANIVYGYQAKMLAERQIPFRVYFSTAFGYDDGSQVIMPSDRDLEKLAREIGNYLNLGTKIVSLADTQSVSDPDMVHEILSKLMDLGIPASKLAYHLHTDDIAKGANLLAAYDLGIRCFETTLGWAGGGCPAVEKNFGNYPTIQAAELLQERGATVPLDIERLKKLNNWIEGNIQSDLQELGYFE